MSRIRKQPRRSNKKISQPLIRNIFATNEEYENVLPIPILSKLKIVEEISVKNLQQFVAEPLEQQLSSNLSQMRHALNQQRAKISSLPIYEDFERLQQLQTQQQIRQQTKKTVNSVHVYLHSEMLMLHSEDDNIFFQEFDDVERRRGGEHRHVEDFLDMDDRLGVVHEEIDILSMIN